MLRVLTVSCNVLNLKTACSAAIHHVERVHCDVTVKDCKRVSTLVADLRTIATIDVNIDRTKAHSVTTDLDFDDCTQPPAKQNEILTNIAATVERDEDKAS